MKMEWQKRELWSLKKWNLKFGVAQIYRLLYLNREWVASSSLLNFIFHFDENYISTHKQTNKQIRHTVTRVEKNNVVWTFNPLLFSKSTDFDHHDQAWKTHQNCIDWRYRMPPSKLDLILFKKVATKSIALNLMN